MVKLTEALVLARSRASDLENVRKLNCWGSELTDISILRKLSNVQVVSLSVNRISTLADFSECKQLEELYIRKNNIQELHEIKHLVKLPKLTKLWLSDNPCAECDKYRLRVLKVLPNLVKLDNSTVTPEEVNQALDEITDEKEKVAETEGVTSVEKHISESCDTVERSFGELSLSQPVDGAGEPVCNTDSAHNTINSTHNTVDSTNNTIDSIHNTINSTHNTIDSTHNTIDSTHNTTDSAHQSPVMMSWDETNKIRSQLGLKPLAVEKVTQMKPRMTSSKPKHRNANILSAALSLVKELDENSLQVLNEAVKERLENM